jgi:hypothetical protein
VVPREEVAWIIEHFHELPPIEVVRVGDRWGVIDGWHRLCVARYYLDHRNKRRGRPPSLSCYDGAMAATQSPKPFKRRPKKSWLQGISSRDD